MLKKTLSPLIFISCFSLLTNEAKSIELKKDDKCFNDKNSIICVGHPKENQVDFSISKTKKIISVKSKTIFEVNKKSDKVFFFLEPNVKKAKLNGKVINIKRQRAPKNEDWIITFPVTKGIDNYSLELEYNLPKLTDWSQNWKPFYFLTDFSDSTDARFTNLFTPSSFEEDRYPMTYSFSFYDFYENIKLYTSGDLLEHKNNTYKIKFSDWNNTASPYFEFTTIPYKTHKFSYKGKYKEIPVTLYFKPNLGISKKLTTDKLALKAEQSIRKTLDNFEKKIGKYPFEKLLVKLYSLQEGDLPLSQEYSMEFGGAIVSRLELIPHELCHQWFGRGSSPKDGKAGFVDELVCDWYDYNNPIKKYKKRPATILSTDNNFTLRTPEEVYNNGIFLAEIGYFYKEKNLSLYPTLSEFYNKYNLSSYSDKDFINLVQKNYGGSLDFYFKRYVYGK